MQRPISLGDAFIQNEAYKRTIGQPNRWNDKITLEAGIRPSEMSRATYTSSGSGVDTTVNYVGSPVLLEQQKLTIRNILSIGQTTMASVHWIKETAFTNYAGMVAEEGEKPEASLATGEASAPVRKIAVVSKVTDEMWNDYPSLRDFINNRLYYMVRAKEEQQLLNGTGAGSEMTGILQTSGIQTQAKAGDTVADAVLKAITKVRSTGFFEPDGIVVHPTDWQTMRLAKDANNQYFGSGPFTGSYGAGPFVNPETYWSLPAVVTTAIAQGTALVGAFRYGAQIWERSGVTIESSNANEDDFNFNRMTIRVELREALSVYRPLAFCTVTGI